MSCCIAVNCVDGRVQHPAIEYLRTRFSVPHVDVVSEWNPAHVLAGSHVSEHTRSVVERVNLLVTVHDVVAVALVAHQGCEEAGLFDGDPIEELNMAVQHLAQHVTQHRVIGLWIDQMGSVQEIRTKEGDWTHCRR